MAINGEIKVRPMMYLALSYDHRIVDGKGAVTFLVRVKEALEDPRRLLMDLKAREAYDRECRLSKTARGFAVSEMGGRQSCGLELFPILRHGRNWSKLAHNSTSRRTSIGSYFGPLWPGGVALLCTIDRSAWTAFHDRETNSKVDWCNFCQFFDLSCCFGPTEHRFGAAPAIFGRASRCGHLS